VFLRSLRKVQMKCRSLRGNRGDCDRRETLNSTGKPPPKLSKPIQKPSSEEFINNIIILLSRYRDSFITNVKLRSMSAEKHSLKRRAMSHARMPRHEIRMKTSQHLLVIESSKFRVLKRYLRPIVIDAN
jgi:hypothetical protein